MKLLKIISVPIIILFCVNCNQSNLKNSFQISLVNLGEVDSYQINFIKSILNENYNIDSVIVIGQDLPEETYYKPRNRYRADKLIQFLKENLDTDKVIGITDKDISTTVDQYEDWGIMGLAYCPGKSCIVSTFRTFRGAKSEEHKKERLKKVTMHEFGHTLGLPHCKNSKSCLMRDANGKVSTVDYVDGYCDKCKSKIQKYLKSKD
ncbi:matrixin family metalloprotease [Moheibacter sediminis]|uniref:Archaemetzincin n=1 Tax=Moheibacter sediminis TaxID=1434700 RepID=A0A1W2C345_9FLAO|nr:matrixin family metalloprotease [Moheibacter sediminis]SMC79322.1 archaemetzincin [Moheibacter sediminis]